ncbi:hypothetical protein L7F22_018219 [Adiantum nelumboides]|nr:hypothetical protein [Adiantum nelumboides]
MSRIVSTRAAQTHRELAEDIMGEPVSETDHRLLYTSHKGKARGAVAASHRSRSQIPLILKECMKGTPAKAHVLYARVEDADKKNRLLCVCNIIKDAFIEAGLVMEKDKTQELKLHATLMHTSYRKRKPGEKFGGRMPFDARPILAVHGSDDWGKYTITEVHLSERFVYDEDRYYHCCGSVKLPS